MLDRSANLFDDDAPTTDAPTPLTVDAESGGSPAAHVEDAVAIPPAVDHLSDTALVGEPRARRPLRRAHPQTSTVRNGVAGAKVAPPAVGRFRKRLAGSAPGSRRGVVAAAIVAALVVVLVIGIAAVLGVGDSRSTVPRRSDLDGAVSRYPDPRSPQIPVLRPTEEQRLRARVRALRAQLRAERRRAAVLRRAARPDHHPTAVKRPEAPAGATTVRPRWTAPPRADAASNRTGAELSVEG
jgi:hypothetical protein